MKNNQSKIKVLKGKLEKIIECRKKWPGDREMTYAKIRILRRLRHLMKGG